ASRNAYAAVHGIERGQKTTDSDGRAVFSGLVAGLYLIAQLDGENSEYIIDPYLVMVPGVNERTRVWDYDVTAQPKTEPVRRDLKVNSLSVYKVWSGTNTPPGGILVQLYRDGVPYGNCVALDAGNHWSHTWNNLNPENTWTVDEFDVAQGYTKAISASAGGFILTNTKNPNAPQTTVVIGSKTWEHGSNPAAQQPKSIVLRIYADGVFLLQKEVGEAEHWSWSVRMDKFDENGREIVYTVDEAPVNDYIKAVDGFDLVNIHKSYTRPDDTSRTNPYVRPITGDLSNPTLWLFLMGTSFAGLLVVAFLFRRSVKKREKRS
ncbi:MAG: Cna B-type domain-containing protein, partial [Oscillospiraceae bacterium]|nr:Cna B-type domain-containing protein [Oscillospiraceae bacterium]